MKMHYNSFPWVQLNNTALVQVMAWRRKSNETLPEPMLTQLTDALMGH